MLANSAHQDIIALLKVFLNLPVNARQVGIARLLLGPTSRSGHWAENAQLEATALRDQMLPNPVIRGCTVRWTNWQQ